MSTINDIVTLINSVDSTTLNSKQRHLMLIAIELTKLCTVGHDMSNKLHVIKKSNTLTPEQSEQLEVVCKGLDDMGTTISSISNQMALLTLELGK